MHKKLGKHVSWHLGGSIISGRFLSVGRVYQSPKAWHMSSTIIRTSFQLAACSAASLNRTGLLRELTLETINSYSEHQGQAGGLDFRVASAACMHLLPPRQPVHPTHSWSEKAVADLEPAPAPRLSESPGGLWHNFFHCSIQCNRTYGI